MRPLAYGIELGKRFLTVGTLVAAATCALGREDLHPERLKRFDLGKAPLAGFRPSSSSLGPVASVWSSGMLASLSRGYAKGLLDLSYEVDLFASRKSLESYAGLLFADNATKRSDWHKTTEGIRLVGPRTGIGASAYRSVKAVGRVLITVYAIRKVQLDTRAYSKRGSPVMTFGMLGGPPKGREDSALERLVDRVSKELIGRARPGL